MCFYLIYNLAVLFLKTSKWHLIYAYIHTSIKLQAPATELVAFEFVIMNENPGLTVAYDCQ